MFGFFNSDVSDFLISFFSDGFPLDKAIAYEELRQPFCVNDLSMQKILWDRRLCLRILDRINVPTPNRLEVNRDGGPRIPSPELARRVMLKTGVKLEGPEDGTGGGAPLPEKVELLDDGEALRVDDTILRKPFVEKPISGEDHNIRIYFSKAHGGGGRRLFRKIGNKSSEMDPNLSVPRAVTEPGSSWIYEQFLCTDNSEDVKAYTVGAGYCHAETRKSPVVDGLVRRNAHGKEVRYVTELSKNESIMAGKIADAFGQRICGFDLLRVGGKSCVIDVNGWSFVKDNNEYYDQCAGILRNMFIQEKQRREGKTMVTGSSETAEKGIQENNTHSSSKGTRRPTGHRSALQNILHRSSSLSRLTGHQLHSHRVPDMPYPTHSQGSARHASPSRMERVSLPQLPTFHSLDMNPLTPPTPPSPDQNTNNNTALQIPAENPPPPPNRSWKLKGMVAVIRHADRTPKQKHKFTFHTKPFIDLLRGHDQEVLLIGESALGSVLEAVKQALEEGIEDAAKLRLLRTSLIRKAPWPGTKVQIKPIFRKRRPHERTDQSPVDESLGTQHEPVQSISSETDVITSPNKAIPTGSTIPGESRVLQRTTTGSASLSEETFSRISAAENNLVLDKLQLVMKWGGEPTHSARYQSQDLGENMRNDLALLNPETLEDVAIYSSSERRVTTSGEEYHTHSL